MERCHVLRAGFIRAGAESFASPLLAPPAGQQCRHPFRRASPGERFEDGARRCRPRGSDRSREGLERDPKKWDVVTDDGGKCCRRRRAPGREHWPGGGAGKALLHRALHDGTGHRRCDPDGHQRFAGRASPRRSTQNAQRSRCEHQETGMPRSPGHCAHCHVCCRRAPVRQLFERTLIERDGVFEGLRAFRDLI